MSKASVFRAEKTCILLTAREALFTLAVLTACGPEAVDSTARPDTLTAHASALVVAEPLVDTRERDAEEKPTPSSGAALDRVSELAAMSQRVEDLQKRLEGLPRSEGAREVLATHRRQLDAAKARQVIEGPEPVRSEKGRP